MLSRSPCGALGRGPALPLLLCAAAAAALGACSDAAPTGTAAPVAAGASFATAAAPPAPGALTSALTSALAPTLCATVQGGGRSAGTALVTATCDGSVAQQFTRQPSGTITVYGGAMCVDAYGAQGRDGDAVIIWTCNGQANQRWTATAAGPITGINSKCVDIYGASTAPGTKLVVWTCTGGANQRWSTTAAARTAPTAPGTPVATAGNAQATITWTAPASAGTSAIQSYRVTSLPGGLTVTVPGSSVTATMTGLTNGTSYTFTVVATNSTAASPASAPSYAVTPTAPSVPPPSSSSGRWVGAYYLGYQRSQYPEANVDFSKTTHLIVGAIEPVNGAGIDSTFFIDNVNGPAMARTLAARAHQAGRKVILMLGGAGHGDQLVTATSSVNRATFVRNVLAAIDKFGYDGVDVDWEPLTSTNQPQALEFLKDLRSARPGVLITWPTGGISPDAWNAKVAPVVDMMSLMTYGMADNWGGWVSWHQAALTGEAGSHPTSVAATVRAFTSVGVPAAKLSVGISTAGACWQGVNQMYVPLDGTSARVAYSDNVMTYANILANYKPYGTYSWDSAAQAGYLSFSQPTGPQQCTMVSYEDETSAKVKADWARTNGLGGAFTWTINQGHLSSAAAGAQDPIQAAAYAGVAP